MKDIKIRSISLKSFKGFDDITIDCAKNDTELYQWTVLLGNNNTGKTRILQAIAGMRTYQLTSKDNKPLKKIIIPQIAPEMVHFSNKYNKQNCEISCILTNYGPWEVNSKALSVEQEDKLENFHIFGYGVSRYPSVNNNNVSEPVQESDVCDTLFSHEKRLVNIQEWLMQLDYSVKNNNQAMQKRLDLVREVICSNIFPEIDDFDFNSTDDGRNYVLFKTKDGKFRYTELGFGYQSMLSWIVDLCKRMFETFPNSENPLLESAVVLVDEIDLHLHPKWQREVISYVSDIFKNVQFIVTTHSPLVIQSMQEVNLYVLRRDDDDKITVEHSPITNFSGWSVEEILRDTMKLDNDIQSNYLQESYRLFDEGLDNNDVAKARDAYSTLIKILHPNNPARRLLKLQLDQMEIND
ncbi:MAG: AAA family ATPase [Bacteroidales bacterium]|nr:AAA family ATPase [Bacteroidales bacterium]MBR4328049.1 AAA family ATPase [Bacteroidales bacterium]